MIDNLRDWLKNQFSLIEFVNDAWANILTTVTMIIIWVVLGYLLKKILTFYFSRRLNKGFKAKDDKHAKTITKMVSNIATFLLVVVLAVVVMGELGVDIATIIASAGIVGLAIGFGAQELIKDLISGFFIIAERIFSVGETVVYGDFRGTVVNIGLRTTTIENIFNESLVVNNSDIRKISNVSRKNSSKFVTFKVAYGTDLKYFGDGFIDYLNAVSSKYDQMIGVPTFFGVFDISSGGVTLMLKFTCVNGQHFALERALLADIYEYCLKHNIGLPGYLIKPQENNLWK